jgi:VCBS repeat-containing protein
MPNNTINGTSNNDLLQGTSGNDTIYGFSGDDIIFGNGGVDIIHGGDGNDIIYGGSSTDTLWGDDGYDIIYGFAGNDTIHGGAGNDFLDGGRGVDTVSGDDGDDTLVFTVDENTSNTTKDTYDGGNGFDKLVINISSSLLNTLAITTQQIENYFNNNYQSVTHSVNFGLLKSGLKLVATNMEEILVNYIPVANNDSGINYSATEDTPLVVNAASGLLANDTDADHNTLTAILVTGPKHGTVALNADGSFTYTPAANYNGTDSFTYKVNDGYADSNIATVSLTIAAVNDAPTIAPIATQTVNEDTYLVFSSTKANLIKVVDVDATLGTIQVTLHVDHGALTLSRITGLTFSAGGNGTSDMTFTGTLTNVNAALASMKYLSNLNYNGSDALVITTSDQGNTGDGGPLTASSTVNINVLAVNDAPINTVPTARTVAEDTALVFSTTNGNAISINDVDAGSGLMKVTLSVTNGVLTLNGTTGLTFLLDSATNTTSDGSADKKMIFTGTITDINNALNGLTYQGKLNYAGADTLIITTSDLGNTGSGGAKTDTDKVAITVTAVNDAPVNYFNGAPITGPVSTSGNEDTALVFSSTNHNAISISDVDAGTSSLQVTLAVSHGTLTLSTITGLTFSSGDGVADTTMTFRGTLAAVNTALRGMAYRPDANYNGPDTLTITTSDQGNTGSGGVLTDSDSVAINVLAVNDAPINTVPLLTQTVAQTNDLFFSSANGNAISIGDIDAGTSSVKVTLSVMNGTLTLSNTSGLTFLLDSVTGLTSDGIADKKMIFTGSITDINAALNSLSYHSNPNFSGSDTLTIVTNDQGNTGSGGAKMDTDIVPIKVTVVNDGPVNTVPSAQSVNEDTTLVFSTTKGNAISISDPDAGMNPVKVTLSVDVGTLTLNSISGLTFISGDGVNDATMTFTGTLSAINFALNGMAYRAGSNYNGSATLSITSNDQGNTGSGGPLTDTDTVTITVNSVNDAPAGTDHTATIAEDTSYTFATSDFGFSDPNDNPANSLLAVKITTLPVLGSLKLDGVAVTAGQFISAADIAADKLVFTPLANANNGSSSSYTSFTFQVQDDGGTANSGANLDQSPNTMTISVTPVNDAPTVDYGISDQSAAASNTFNFAIPSDAFKDIDGDTLIYTATLMDGSPLPSWLSFNGSAFSGTPNSGDVGSITVRVTASDGSASVYDDFTITVASTNVAPVATADSYATDEDTALHIAAPGVLANDTDVDSPSITAVLVIGPSHASSFTLNADGSFDYTPLANYAGPDSFTYKANDGTADGNTVTVSITVNSVNDAPIVANAIPDQTIAEDTAFNFIVPSNTFSDVENDSLTYSASLGDGSSLPGWLSFNPGTRTFDGTPPQDFNGTISLKVTASDGNGGTVSDNFDLIITPVNDAPAGTDKTVSMLEDNSYTFTAADFGFSDSIDGNSLLAVKITTLPGAGSLKLDGVAVTVGQTISVTDLDANKLVFTPAANGNGATYATFTFQVQDDGGTANGGVDLDPTPNLITFSVTAVNDAPVNAVPGAQTVDEDTGLVFSSSNPGGSNAITISDVDAGSGLVQVTLSASDFGTLTLDATRLSAFPGYVAGGGGSAGGGSVGGAGGGSVGGAGGGSGGSSGGSSTVIGNGSPTITLTGTVADINAVLEGLTYRGALNYNGQVTLTVTTNDQGNTGIGGAKTDSDTITITVNAVNDAPMNFAPHNDVTNPIHVDEDTTLAFTGPNSISISDVDAGSNAVQVTLSVVSGTLTLSDPDGLATGNGTSHLVLNGTVSAINAALTGLTYHGAQDFNGADTLTITTNDLGNTGSGGAMQTQSTVAIMVDAVNDAPVNHVPDTSVTPLTVSEGDALVFTGSNDISISDVDANGQSEQVTLTVSNGTLTLGDTSGLDSFFYTNNNATVTLTGTIDAINAALSGLTYQGNLGFSGADTLMITTNDLGNTGSGDALPVQDTVTIMVTPVNHAPDGTDKTVHPLEGNAYIFGTTDFGFTDSNDSPANSLLAVKITTLPDAGSLKLDGVNVNAGDFISAADIAMGLLVFTPDAGGSSHASFTFQVQDNGGTANGGVDLDQIANTFTIDAIARVNDAPVGQDDVYFMPVNLEQSGGRFGPPPVAPTVLNVAASQGVLANDTDANGDTLTAALKIDSVTGLPIGPTHASSFTFNPDGSFSYTPDVGFTGTDSFTYTANDGTLDGNDVTVTIYVSSPNLFTTNGDSVDLNTVDSFDPTVDYWALDGNDYVYLPDAAHAASLYYNPANTFYAGDGDDIIIGRDINNIINGGNGNDYIAGGIGHDVVEGGTGADTIVLGPNLLSTDYVSPANSADLFNPGAQSITESSAADPADFNSDNPAYYNAAFSGTYDLASATGSILDLNDLTVQAAITEIPRSNFGDVSGWTDANEFTNPALPSTRVDGTLASTNDIDLYKVTLNAGETFIADVDDNISDFSTHGLYTTLTLYDTNGNAVAFNANGLNGTGLADTGDVISGSFNGTDFTVSSFLTYTALTPGDYYLRIESYYNSESGSYRINMSIQPEISPVDNSVASYEGSTAGVNIDLSTADANGVVIGQWGDAQGDQLIGVHNILGSANNDILTGDDYANWLRGGAGDDTISGGAGNDVLDGGAGADTVDGGTGDDTLVYNLQENLHNSSPDQYYGDAGNDTLLFNTSPGVLEQLGLTNENITNYFNAHKSAGTVDFTNLNPAINLIVYDVENIQVATLNLAPLATPIPTQFNQEDTAVTFDVSPYFLDPNGDTLTFSASGLPAGLSIDSNTGIISGTLSDVASPIQGQGSNTVSITADDGHGGSVLQIFSWNVTVTPPVALPDEIDATEGVALPDNPTLSVATNDSDPKGDTLTYALTGGSIPYGFSLRADGTYTFDTNDPSYDSLAEGETTDLVFIYTVTNSRGGSAESTLTIHLTGSNDQPALTLTPILVSDDGATITNVNVINSVDDYDNGSNFTYTASGLPDGITMDLNTGLLNGTLAHDASQAPYYDDSQNPYYLVTVTVDDGSGATNSTDSQTFKWYMFNPAPVARGYTIDVTQNDSAPSGTLVGTVVSGDYDPDGDTFTYSYTPGTLPAGFLLDANGIYSFDPSVYRYLGAGESTTVTANYTLTDSQGAVSNPGGVVTITVHGLNDAPVAAADSYSTDEDTPLSVAVPGVLSNDTDVDGDSLHAVLVAGPAHASSFTLNADGSFDYTPAADYNGPDSFTYKANDGTADSGTVTVSITVKAVNDAPTVDAGIPNQSAMELDPFIFNIPNDAFADIDIGDHLTYTASLVDAFGVASPLPDNYWLSLTNGQFTGTPFESDVGTITIRVTATDTHNATAYTNFNLTVNYINDPPTVATSITDQFTREDVAFSFTVPSTTFADADLTLGDQLHYTAKLTDGSALPIWLSFDAPTLTFSGTPTNGDIGSINIRVTATDNDGLAAHADYTLTITPALFTTGNDTDVDLNNVSLFIPATDYHALAGDDSVILPNAATMPAGYDPSYTFYGDDGNDVILGGDLNDIIDGGAGNDILNGYDGDDILYGGDGDDYLVGGTGNDILYGGDGQDILFGGDGDDILYGGDGDDTLDGGAGNDLLDGGKGADAINGGGGFNTVTYTNSTSSDGILGVTVNLATGLGSGNDAEGDTYANISAVIGSDFNDTLIAGAGPATLYGGDGKDTLIGGDGNDLLDGGAGDDTLNGGAGGNRLTGGAGADTFVFDSTSSPSADIVTDFRPSEGDKLGLTAFGISSSTTNFSFASQSGFDTLLTIGENHFITLENTDVTNINGSWFTAAPVIPNHAPVANNDTYNMPVGETLVIGASHGVLVNDTDADDNPLSVSLVNGPANGDLTLNSDGSFSYAPALGFTGADTFTYTVNDGTVDSSPTTVIINVAEPHLFTIGSDFLDLNTVNSFNSAVDYWALDSTGDEFPFDYVILPDAAGLISNPALASYDPSNIFYGDAGLDQIIGRDLNNFINGGAGSDYLYSGIAQDVIEGGADGDSIYITPNLLTTDYATTDTDFFNSAGQLKNIAQVVTENNDDFLTDPQTHQLILDSNGYPIPAVSNFNNTDSAYLNNDEDFYTSLPLSFDDPNVLGAITTIDRSQFGNIYGDVNNNNAGALSNPEDFTNPALPSVRVEGTLADKTDIDLYKITLHAGETFIADMDQTDFSSTLVLYDAAGNALAFASYRQFVDTGDISNPNNFYNGIQFSNSAFLTYTSLAGGDYYLRIANDHYSGNDGTGDAGLNDHYTINMSIQPETSPTVNSVVSYETSPEGVTIDLSATTTPDYYVGGLVVTGQGGDAEGDYLVNAHNILGSAFNDTLIGDDYANWLRGGAGDDLISGGVGNDVLDGGAGADTVSGGAGDDTLVYNLKENLGNAQADEYFGDDGNDTLVFNASSILLSQLGLTAQNIINYFNANASLGTVNFANLNPNINLVVHGVEHIEVISPSAVNLAPVATAIANQSDVDTASIGLDVSIYFSDPNGDTLSFSASGLPTGLSISSAGLISGTFDSNDALSGPFSVVVTASDGNGGSTNASFLWTVTALPPVVQEDPPLNATEGGAVVTGDVSTNDSDPYGGTLTYALVDPQNAPVGLIFNSDGTFSFDPTSSVYDYLNEGEHANPPLTVSYTATNSHGGTAQGTLTIDLVGTNDAPTLTLSTDSLSSNDSDVIYENLIANVTDPDAHNYTFSANSALQEMGLNIDPTTGVITGILNSSASQGSPYLVTIFVDDGTGTATSVGSQSFYWYVNNPTPVITNAADSFSVTENDPIYSGTLAGNAYDPDGDTLFFSSDTLPAGFALNPNGTYTFDASNPAYDASPSGTFHMLYTVTDADGATAPGFATLTINFTGGVNDAPRFSAIPNQSNHDGTANISFNILPYVTDPDSAIASFSATGLPDGLSINPANGFISGTLTNTDSASSPYTVTIYATDNLGAVGSQTFTWTITNPAPVAADDNETISQGSGIFDGSVAGNDYDPDNDSPLTFTLNGVAPTGFILNSDGTYTLDTSDPTYTYLSPSDTLDIVVPYTVTDAQGATDTATLIITMTGSNDAPVTTQIADQSSFEGAFINFNAAAYFSDPENDILTYSVSPLLYIPGVGSFGTGQELPGGLSISSDGVISGTIDSNASDIQGGVYYVHVVADDGNGGESIIDFYWTVTNPAPVATDATVNVNEESVLTGSLTAYVSDDDAPGTLTFALQDGETAPIGFILNTDGSYTFDAADPTYAFLTATQTVDIVVPYTVTDPQGASDNATLTITITGVNSAPEVANGIANQSIDEDTSFDFIIPMDAFSDPDSSSWTYTSYSAVLANDNNAAFTGFSLDPSGTFSGMPPQDYNGDIIITVTASDGERNVDSTFTLTVTPVNDAPVVADPLDDQRVEEGIPFSFIVPAGSFTDADGDSLTYTATLDDDSPLPGWLTFDSNTLTFSGTAPIGLRDTFIIKVTAADDVSSVSDSFDLRVTEVNQAPVSDNDSYSTAEDTPLIVTAPGVLINDTDSNSGDLLSAVIVTGPSHAQSFTFNANGSFSYTPNQDFFGTDTFTYKVNDGTVDGNTATVTITVTPVNDPPVAVDDSYLDFIVEDTPVELVTIEGVLSNDFDVDSSSLSAILVRQAFHGTVSLSADGSFSYTPDANFWGTDTFTYKVNDGSADSNVATVTLYVHPVNDGPAVGIPDSYTMDEDSVLTINATNGVLANDTDPDNDPLVAYLVDEPTHGTLIFNSYGSFSYTPNPNFFGTDNFTYSPSDGSTISPVTTVTITVNNIPDAPVAVDDSYSVDEDTPLSISALSLSVLYNDLNVDGNPLTAILVSGPAHAQLFNLKTDGTFDYIPTANFFGTDSFTYKINDGTTDSNTATVTITVNGTPDAPIAVADSYTVAEDSTNNIFVVLANDNDPDGDPLTVSLLNGVAHGSLTLNADGSFTYTPNANFYGSDIFSYQLSDGTGLISDPVFVSIAVTAVNDAPLAVADNYSMAKGTTLNIPAAGVLANDTDVESDPLTATLVDDVEHGSLVFNSDGSFTYTPDPDFNGADSFTYKANDGTVDGNTATVNIIVNAAPVATNDVYTTDEDTALTVPTLDVNGVLFNDNDADSNPLTAILVSGPAHGILNLNANGSFTYTPAENYAGDDSFTYKVNDGTVDSNTATVTITVNPVNDAPVAIDDSYTVVSTPGETLSVQAIAGVLANDTDVDGDPLTATVVDGVEHGSLVFNSDGSFTYTPAENYAGDDSFTYKVNDGTVDGNIATVTITVLTHSDYFTSGNDVINFNTDVTGTISAVDYQALGGNDTVTLPDAAQADAIGYYATNTFYGGAGNDIIIGGNLNDIIDGDAGDDTIFGGAGNDILQGDIGNDFLDGGPGNDIIDGGPGIDTVSYKTASMGLVVDLSDVNADGSVTAYLNSGEFDTLFSIENIIGTDGADIITGDDNDNILEGGLSGDLIDGRGGHNTASYAHASSGVYAVLDGIGQGGEANGDQLTHIQDLIGSAFDDTLVGNNDANTLYGGTGNDTLIGGAGNDVLYGDDGSDTLDGGLGADTLDGGDGTDTATYANSTSGVTVDLSNNANNAGDFAAGDTLIHIEGVIGSIYDDTLIGDAGNNTFYGGNGDDDLQGNAGDDTLYGELGNDTLRGGDGNDTLSGGFGNDTLIGGNGNDTLYGNENDDTLEGGAGADTLDGGAGINTATYANSPDAVTVDLSNNANNAGGEAAGDILVNIQNVIGSAFNDTITGNSQDNTFYGGTGDDTLIGGAGNDTLYGGDGNDTGDDGNDTLRGGDGIDFLYGENGDDTFEGDAGSNFFYGGAGFNTVTYDWATSSVSVSLLTGVGDHDIIYHDIFTDIQAVIGSSYDDFLDGSNNADTLYGGAGNDILQGRGGDDILVGDAGDDLLEGGAGADLLDGGTGIADSNTASYASSTSSDNLTGVTIDLSPMDLNLAGTGSGNDAEGDKLYNIQNIIGSDFDDDITGNSAVNVLDGGFGDDIIHGGAGNDTLYGGVGNDTLYGDAGDDTFFGGNGADTYYGGNDTSDDGFDTVSYINADSKVYVDLSLGTVVHNTNIVDTLYGIEKVIGSNYNDTLIGSSGDDYLDGGRGSDILEGGEGADTLDGGDQTYGRDTASYASSLEGVTVDLTDNANNAGGDATGDILINITNVIGSDHQDFLTGNDDNNDLYGGAGNDTLYGGAGNDQLIGGDGDDILDGGTGADYLIGGNGFDTVTYANSSEAVTVDLSNDANNAGGDAAGDILGGIEKIIGSSYADSLTGNVTATTLDGGDGDDTLIGKSYNGDDTLIGGSGNDFLQVNDSFGSNTLTGGTGADTFKFIQVYDYSNDVIEDFNTSGGSFDINEGDKLNLTWYGVTADNFSSLVTQEIVGSDTILHISGTANTITLIGVTDTIASNWFTGQINEPPVAKADSGYTVIGASGNTLSVITSSGVLVNDTDINGDSLTAVLATQATYGTVSLSTDGSFTYTLINDFSGDGTDIFTYTANDGNSNSNVVTVTITVLAASSYFTMGSDTVDFNSIGSVTTADYYALAGNDTVTLPNADTIPTGYSAANVFYGGAGEDTITGGSLNDIIEGGAGADTIDGDAGINTASYALSAAAVTVDLSDNSNNHYGDAEGDMLSNIQNLIGSVNDDTLIGITGSVLEGGAGSDTLTGASGATNVTASYEHSSAAVSIDLSTGSASGGDADGDTLSNIQNLIGSAYDDTLIGITGSVLEGGAGRDTLTGASGATNVTVSYEHSNAGVLVDLSSGTAYSDGYEYNDTLSNIQNLIGSVNDDSLAGDGNNNTLTGGAGNDWLNGDAGNDTLFGGAGDDTLLGGAGNDTLNGGDGNDTLQGGDGDDVLDGGSGTNQLTGGNGADIFNFSSSDTFYDVITDFSKSADKLDLSEFGITSASSLTDINNILQAEFSSGGKSVMFTIDANHIITLQSSQGNLGSVSTTWFTAA